MRKNLSLISMPALATGGPKLLQDCRGEQIMRSRITGILTLRKSLLRWASILSHTSLSVNKRVPEKVEYLVPLIMISWFYLEICGHASSRTDNSSTTTPAGNSSVDGRAGSSEPNNDDDPPVSFIWSDIFLDDSSWNFQATGEDYSELGVSNSSSDDSISTWFLDCEDLGDEFFGLSCFSDMDLSILDLGGKH
ncbi:hypothetical protein OIU74_017191 [Salix koriyanagi]|uniref:Uncharacterized protein n=1 Tax=Salix koriyanagi TaxID=2511006 RepID=A0A9Q0PIU8_9ROSI|nr:hypothetical protein OIU74_017191 [Salix koriyanagi]